ncbi:hypothetical protein B0T16DRAFT_320519 [Cercophora newfieldiana]|uniref:Uncharacterized protein n=1 Tax=Cercophora newfieldiana TaxID=92897 RepID=A0AA39YPA7_9PEZI|nr:hypothetical protein B0T16DRAFT_320519 [Cercophora newfieldiana]
MPRTITRNEESVSVPGVFEIVFTSPPPAVQGGVTITFRTGPDVPSTGLHWHETHTEYLQMIQGCALITVGDQTAVFTNDSGVVAIPRHTVHEVMRADSVEEGKHCKDVELVIYEWADPSDGDKDIFFRNLLGLMKDSRRTLLRTVSLGISMVVLSGAHDNYPVFWGGPKFVGRNGQSIIVRGVTYALMKLIGAVGWVVGRQPEYDGYTPRKSGRSADIRYRQF